MVHREAVLEEILHGALNGGLVAQALSAKL